MSQVGLTTHVLDAVHGAGAPGVRIELYLIEDDKASLASIAVTRANGRAELLDGPDLKAGEYEIVFAVGDYFRAQGAKAADPSFIDDVPVRFVVTDSQRHYHVPLIASPWTYSTYRGGMPPTGE